MFVYVCVMMCVSVCNELCVCVCMHLCVLVCNELCTSVCVGVGEVIRGAEMSRVAGGCRLAACCVGGRGRAWGRRVRSG